MEIKQTKDINGYSIQLDISHSEVNIMKRTMLLNVQDKLTNRLVDIIIQDHKQEIVSHVLNQDLGKAVLEKVADKLLKLLQKETK